MTKLAPAVQLRLDGTDLAIDTAAMLQMRPGCECCDVDLPADSAGAMICSFECTFCADCAATRLGGRCPNCGGALVARPPRAAALLGRFPASAERVLKPHPGCAA